MQIPSLFETVRHCLLACDPQDKTALTLAACASFFANRLALTPRLPVPFQTERGVPPRVAYVPVNKLSRRSVQTARGRAIMMHAIAHIEFNAIDLALDAVFRFQDCPPDYYRDWMRVAEEETRHFMLVQGYLTEQGYRYGDFPAHQGLWHMAQLSGHDVLVRMALIPRVMEARGLDASPRIMAKFHAAGDTRAVEILQRILHDEIQHVAFGTRWFHYFCDQRGLPKEETFRNLIHDYFRDKQPLPLHRDARAAAGFSAAEMDYLESLGRNDEGKSSAKR